MVLGPIKDHAMTIPNRVICVSMPEGVESTVTFMPSLQIDIGDSSFKMIENGLSWALKMNGEGPIDI